MEMSDWMCVLAELLGATEMSVTTTADEKVDSVRTNVREATKALAEVVIEDCWGADEFTPEFKTTLREVMNDLLDIKNRLGS